MTSAPPVDFTTERLIRQAPDRVLAFSDEDRAYLKAAFAALRAAFPDQAPPPPPLTAIPARALMRMLVDLRRSLRPLTPDQREAKGRLAGAIVLLDTACAFAIAHDRVHAESDGPGGA